MATGNATGSGSGVTATVSFNPGSAVTCTFSIFFNAATIKTATQAAIKGFMQNRADVITSSQPRQTRGEGRLTGSLFGGPDECGDDEPPAGCGSRKDPLPGAAPVPQAVAANPALVGGSATAQRGVVLQVDDKPKTDTTVASPLNLSGSDSAGGGTASAFISRAASRRPRLSSPQTRRRKQGFPITQGPEPVTSQAPRSSICGYEVNTNYFLSNYQNKQSGYTQIAYAGFDYPINPAVLIGVLTEMDWARETGSLAPLGVSNSSANGLGWMVGPYTAVKITPQITFDARAAWGQSTNGVNPFGLYEDTFNTDRELAAGRLSGTWRYGCWRFSPEASLVYFSETQKAFNDVNAVNIPSQNVSLGRFTFGPEVGYQLRQANGGIYEPYLGLKGVYDFTKQDAVALDGSLTAPEIFRGKVEAGLAFKSLSGFSIQGSASYDGVGAKNSQDFQGQLSVRLPLN